ncbi:MAG: hypothetical protein Q7T84_07865 [Phenylobacterium sp.]|uniref:hypothetical protein n=1 Tax=Phenylobacterium sp. TaxID=1871053 RepID=UPI002718B465|nr:hypothetical protein [Phenylobacterium sp.]MDO9431204.1 hypothetical protein [Phenylobacterium sp.]
MQMFMLTLKDRHSGIVGVATLLLANDAAARDQAAIHLSASPHFQRVEIRRGAQFICTVHRDELDMLGRPRIPQALPAKAA